MATMLHEITLKAPAEDVYRALTTEAGLLGWWTRDVVAEARVGSVAQFGFNNRSTVFQMRIDELTPGRRVVWTCVDGPDEWKETQLTWQITSEEKITTLRFTHDNWQSTDQSFAMCNTIWGELMFRLRRDVLGERPGPLFNE